MLLFNGVPRAKERTGVCFGLFLNVVRGRGPPQVDRGVLQSKPLRMQARGMQFVSGAWQVEKGSTRALLTSTRPGVDRTSWA